MAINPDRLLEMKKRKKRGVAHITDESHYHRGKTGEYPHLGGRADYSLKDALQIEGKFPDREKKALKKVEESKKYRESLLKKLKGKDKKKPKEEKPFKPGKMDDVKSPVTATTVKSSQKIDSKPTSKILKKALEDAKKKVPVKGGSTTTTAKPTLPKTGSPSTGPSAGGASADFKSKVIPPVEDGPTAKAGDSPDYNPAEQEIIERTTMRETSEEERKAIEKLKPKGKSKWEYLLAGATPLLASIIAGFGDEDKDIGKFLGIGGDVAGDSLINLAKEEKAEEAEYRKQYLKSLGDMSKTKSKMRDTTKLATSAERETYAKKGLPTGELGQLEKQKVLDKAYKDRYDILNERLNQENISNKNRNNIKIELMKLDRQYKKDMQDYDAKRYQGEIDIYKTDQNNKTTMERLVMQQTGMKDRQAKRLTAGLNLQALKGDSAKLIRELTNRGLHEKTAQMVASNFANEQLRQAGANKRSDDRLNMAERVRKDKLQIEKDKLKLGHETLQSKSKGDDDKNKTRMIKSRKDWLKLPPVDRMYKAADGISGLVNVLNDTSASDMSFLYQLIKSVDRDSVVRPGEIELATSTLSMLEEMKVNFSKFGIPFNIEERTDKDGKKWLKYKIGDGTKRQLLPPSVKKDFVEAALDTYRGYLGNFDDYTNSEREFYERIGDDPDTLGISSDNFHRSLERAESAFEQYKQKHQKEEAPVVLPPDAEPVDDSTEIRDVDGKTQVPEHGDFMEDAMGNKRVFQNGAWYDVPSE